MRLTTVILVTFVAAAAVGGVNVWTTAGPKGVNVSSLFVDPADANTLFVLTSAGIYKTSDGGGNWTSVNEGLPDTASVSASMLAAGDPETLYAALSNGELWVSVDRGQRWSLRGMIPVYANGLAYDNTGALYATTVSGVFSSHDAGATWEAMGVPDVPGRQVDGIAVSATSTYAFFLGWSPSGPRAFRSPDGGQTWRSLSNIPTTPLQASHDSATVLILVGQTVYVSTDETTSWSKLSPVPADLIYGVLTASGTIYAATSKGVFTYSVAAKTWRLISRAAETRNLTVVTAPDLRLYATPQTGIIESVDGNWIGRTNGLPGARVSDVAMSTSEPRTAYTLTSAGGFVSDDAGENWKQLPVAGTQIVVSPDNANTVYAGGGTGIFKSVDHGNTWVRTNPSSASRLAIAQSDPATLYAVFTAGLAKTADGGGSWSWVTGSIPFDSDYYGFSYGFEISSMAVDPSNSDHVVVANYGGLFATRDGGASWHSFTAQDPSALAIDAADAIYGARYKQGLIKSVDDGATWSAVGLADKWITSLAVTGTRVYAGTHDGHIYRSEDGGVFWSGLDDGLSRGAISSIAVDGSSEYLYAGTDAGVYQIQVVADNVAVSGDSARPIDDLFRGAAFVVPVAGKASDAKGTIFTTDVTWTNRRETEQPVVIMWLPLGSGEAPQVFRTNLSPGDSKILDINARLSVVGIGSLAVFATDAAGTPDAEGAIDGSARIWRHPADGRAPFAQSIGSATSSLLQPHRRATIDGVHQDARTRVNVGVVNLSAEAHQFTVANVTFAVPALSFVQRSLPEGDIGSIEAFADSSSTRWIVYASAIDRTTEEAQTVLGQPSD